MRSRVWESGLIAEYLLQTYPERPAATPPLAALAYRPKPLWRDKMILAAIQTFGTAETTISQMTWSGVRVSDYTHLARSAEKLHHILAWLEMQTGAPAEGFLPGSVSIQDIFPAAHVRFILARPLDIDVGLDKFAKIAALLDRLDERESFEANPVWWWKPGVTGSEPDDTPVLGDSVCPEGCGAGPYPERLVHHSTGGGRPDPSRVAAGSERGLAPGREGGERYCDKINYLSLNEISERTFPRIEPGRKSARPGGSVQPASFGWVAEEMSRMECSVPGARIQAPAG